MYCFYVNCSNCTGEESYPHSKMADGIPNHEAGHDDQEIPLTRKVGKSIQDRIKQLSPKVSQKFNWPSPKSPTRKDEPSGRCSRSPVERNGGVTTRTSQSSGITRTSHSPEKISMLVNRFSESPQKIPIPPQRRTSLSPDRVGNLVSKFNSKSSPQKPAFRTNRSSSKSPERLRVPSPNKSSKIGGLVSKFNQSPQKMPGNIPSRCSQSPDRIRVPQSSPNRSPNGGLTNGFSQSTQRTNFQSQKYSQSQDQIQVAQSSPDKSIRRKSKSSPHHTPDRISALLDKPGQSLKRSSVDLSRSSTDSPRRFGIFPSRSRTNTLTSNKPFSSELKGWDFLSSSSWSLCSQTSLGQTERRSSDGSDQPVKKIPPKKPPRLFSTKADKMKWRHGEEDIRRPLLWKIFCE